MIVYRITNKINGKSYVGQTVRSLEKRWKEHCQRSNVKTMAISNALHKYGAENFYIEILEECPSLEEMNKKEEYYIKSLNTLSPEGYNLKTGGDSKKWSEESKKKLSNSKKGKPGLPRSEKTRKKMSDTHVGVKKHAGFSDLMSEVKKHLKIPVYCATNGKQYESISQASKDTGVHSGHICQILSGKIKQSKGYVFKKV